ncbi:PIN domain-containing protein [Nocardia cyriacigeorgica]|uniref:PIN domain-containing protein n=1 Tax=Nocardia cyriacigeorgica TaxID=135487 RepID=UPI002455C6CA|nr:PIN domain-containing protein [Nocardia cyriacigeorgica]
MAILVVVDANVLRSSPNLQLNPWQSLLDQQEEWDLELIVPEVALHEAVHLLRVSWMAELEKIQGLNIGNLLDLDGQKQELADIVMSRIDQLEQWFLDSCEEHGISVVSPPEDIDWMDIASRAIYRQPPYNEHSDRSKDGFRDTLIWHTLLTIAAEDTESEVWFVSANSKDFGEPGLEARKLNDWSVPFHPALVSELEDRGLAERVHYVTNMPRLVSNLSARFKPIGEDEFQGLLTQLDKASLVRALMERIDNLPLDPRTAALDLNVQAGRVAKAREPDWENWHFEECARTSRPGGWRARFEIDAQVDIDTAEVAGEGTVHDKWLRFSGDLTVLPDGSTAQLVVTTAEALPDDPMRARWKRVDAGSRAVAAQDWMLGALGGSVLNESWSNFAGGLGPAWLAKAAGITQPTQAFVAQVDRWALGPPINIAAPYAGMGIDIAFPGRGITVAGRDPAMQDRLVHEAAKKAVGKKRSAKDSAAKKAVGKKPSANDTTARKAVGQKARAKEKTRDAPNTQAEPNTTDRGRGSAAS